MEDNKKTELNDDLLNNVAGGRTGFDFGSPAAQADTVLVLLPPDATPEEDVNKRIVPDILGRL